MDTELVRFRINPELRQKAEKVCADLGLELNDVLRAFVTRIARDSALPFDLGTIPTSPAPGHTPFHDYDARLWSSIKPQIDAEVAIGLLARFIADCSTRIDEAANGGASDPDLVVRLTRDRDDARKLRGNLDVADAASVSQVIDKYGPLVRARAG